MTRVYSTLFFINVLLLNKNHQQPVISCGQNECSYLSCVLQKLDIPHEVRAVIHCRWLCKKVTKLQNIILTCSKGSVLRCLGSGSSSTTSLMANIFRFPDTVGVVYTSCKYSWSSTSSRFRFAVATTFLKFEVIVEDGKWVPYTWDITVATSFHLTVAFFPVALFEIEITMPLVIVSGVSWARSPTGVGICKLQNKDRCT